MLGKVVSLRISEKLFSAIKSDADSSDKSVAAYIRGSLIDMYAICDTSDVQRSQPRRTRMVIPGLEEIARLSNAVRMCNGALVQMAKAVHEVGDLSAHSEAEATLIEMRRVARQLSDMIHAARRSEVRP